MRLQPDRVVVIKPSALGDVVNAFHALSALRAHWPHARYSWVINRSLRGLVDGHPHIDDVIEYDRAGSGLGPGRLANLLRFLGMLRSRRFDVAIDMQGLLRSGIMTFATGAPVRVGLADAREGATWFYTHRVVAPLNDTHAVDRLLAIASAFGAEATTAGPVLAVGESDRDWARRVLAGLGRPRLALNLGARWETKRWPPEHFVEIAKRAVAERGAGLIAVGAPEDRPFVDDFIARLDPIPVLDLCGRTTLAQLGALAGEMDVVLSNDTGPLHLATAAGARVVGIYTCTSPALNGPYGPRATTVSTDVDCKASYLVHCPHGLICMSELTPDRVWPKVLAQLDAALGSSAVAPSQR
jgi:lipopolysaccharide heptosyltransferase II